MLPVVTACEMRQSEERLFETGVSSFSVVERAAARLTDEITDILKGTGKTCIFACGSGGNGADGYAAARLFTQKGGRAIVVEVYPAKSEDCIKMKALAKKCVFAVAGTDAVSTLPMPDAWIDCVFGTGLSKPVEPAVSALICRMNQDRKKGACVISCDIPSGLNSDTGEIMGDCVEADFTVSFEYRKRGHLLGCGPDQTGEIRVRPIGVDERYLSKGCAQLIEIEDVRAHLPKRKKTAHKNDFGHLLVIAGSFGMAGAGAMCAKAALRFGVGLVTIACARSLVPIYQMLVPEAMCIALDEENGAVSDAAEDTIKEALKGKTAVAFGPGLGKNASVKALEAVLKSGIKAVIDADGLNMLSENKELTRLLNKNHALTPHPGEAKRLIGHDLCDPVESAIRLNSFGACAVLKGAVSIIIKDETVLFSSSGTNGMAKGGSGDVLCGMVGALLAGGTDAEDALWLASEIHGIAGEIAERKMGTVGMLPTDTIDCIGEAYESVIRD